jgi:hypothetical protein
LHGYEPGSCTRAILENDLAAAVANADASSQRILVDIVKYIYNHLPGEAWGSKAKVDAWMANRRLQARQRKESGTPPEDIRDMLRGAKYIKNLSPKEIKIIEKVQLISERDKF